MTNSIRNNIKSCTYSIIPPSSLITEHDQLSIDHIHHAQELFDQATCYNIHNLQAISCYLSSVKHYTDNNADKDLFEKILAFAQDKCRASDLIIYAAQLFETDDDLLEGLLAVFPLGYRLSVTYQQGIKIINVHSLSGISLQIYSTSPLAEVDIARAKQRHHDKQQQQHQVQQYPFASQISFLRSLSASLSSPPATSQQKDIVSRAHSMNESPAPKAPISLATPGSMVNNTPITTTITSSADTTTITYYSHNYSMSNQQQEPLRRQSNSAKSITMSEGTACYSSSKEYSGARFAHSISPKPSASKTKERTQHASANTLATHTASQSPITSSHNHYHQKRQQPQQPENTSPLTAATTPSTPLVTHIEGVVNPIRKSVSYEILSSETMTRHQQEQKEDAHFAISSGTSPTTDSTTDVAHGTVRPLSSSLATQQRKGKNIKLAIGPPPPRKISQQQHGNSSSNSKRSLYTPIFRYYNNQSQSSRYTPYPVNASTGSSTLHKQPDIRSYRITLTDTPEVIPFNTQLPLPQSQRGRQAPLPPPASGSLSQQKYGEHSLEENHLEHLSSPPAQQQHHLQQPLLPRVRRPSSNRQQPPGCRLPEPPQQSLSQSSRSLINAHGFVEPEQLYQSPMDQQRRALAPQPPLLQTSIQQRREQQQLLPSQRQTSLVQTPQQPQSVISRTRLDNQNPYEIQKQQSTTTSLPKQSVESLPASPCAVVVEEQSNNQKAVPDKKEVPIDSQQEEQKQQSFITAKEAELIDQIREYLQRDIYQYFLKLLNLYSNDIIDTDRLIVNLMPLFEGKIELLEQLQKLVGYGVESHNERSLQIITPIIPKPNLLRCAKVNGSPSYRKMADLRWVNQPCSARDALCREVLNDVYVSYPTEQSEGGDAETFKLNKYEEQLHRSEEKRYELDCMIDDNEKAIVQLQLLRDEEQIDFMDDTQKAEFNNTVNVNKFIYIKAIKQAYGKRLAPKALQGFKECPAQNIPIIIEFLEKEGEEWRKRRSELLPIWRETEAESYYLSLEYQSKRSNKVKGRNKEKDKK